MSACHGLEADCAMDGNSEIICDATSAETAGPFPTRNPASLAMIDIRSDRTGVELSMQISIKNKNNDCAPMQGAVVDVWHCDKDGNYSEYGGTGMQSADYTSAHFLRGRQTTGADGVAAFTTIFPGWYTGRAPHIHVEVFNADGKSLLVTQIALQKSATSAVYRSSLYASRGEQDTLNENDNVFKDGYADEIAILSGSPSLGYSLKRSITVEG